MIAVYYKSSENTVRQILHVLIQKEFVISAQIPGKNEKFYYLSKKGLDTAFNSKPEYQTLMSYCSRHNQFVRHNDELTLSAVNDSLVHFSLSKTFRGSLRQSWTYPFFPARYKKLYCESGQVCENQFLTTFFEKTNINLFVPMRFLTPDSVKTRLGFSGVLLIKNSDKLTYMPAVVIQPEYELNLKKLETLERIIYDFAVYHSFKTCSRTGILVFYDEQEFETLIPDIEYLFQKDIDPNTYPIVDYKGVMRTIAKKSKKISIGNFGKIYLFGLRSFYGLKAKKDCDFEYDISKHHNIEEYYNISESLIDKKNIFATHEQRQILTTFFDFKEDSFCNVD